MERRIGRPGKNQGRYCVYYSLVCIILWQPIVVHERSTGSDHPSHSMRWLAGWQTGRWLGPGGVGALKAAQGRPELTHTPPALIWQFTSTVTECQPSPVEVGRGWPSLESVAAGRRARHLLLRALWHQVKGVVVVVVVPVVVVVVGCETFWCGCCRRHGMRGVTQTRHGSTLHVAPCRSLPPRIAGCVSGLLLDTATGEGKKGSCPGLWVTPDTQSSQFVASRTISVPACLGSMD